MSFPEAGRMLQVAEGQQRLLKLAEEAAGASSPCSTLLMKAWSTQTQIPQ